MRPLTSFDLNTIFLGLIYLILALGFGFFFVFFSLDLSYF